jgi:tripartite-type tricarboxylate transporter receptor subunit TctC
MKQKKRYKQYSREFKVEAVRLFANIGPGIAQAKAGRVRALATTGAKPSPMADGLPTMAAAGLPGFEAEAKGGFLLRRGRPKR